MIQHQPSSTLFPYTTLFRSGDGTALVPQYTNQFGTYQTDASNSSIEFQAGSFSPISVAGSAGGLLVSGASVSLYGSGTLTTKLDVKAGSLSWIGGATLDQLT